MSISLRYFPIGYKISIGLLVFFPPLFGPICSPASCGAERRIVDYPKQASLVDYEFHEDFENGTISGWSSYPPFQDTAYDYSILAGYYRPPETLQGYIASGEFFYPVGLSPPGNQDTNKFYCLRAYRPNSIAPQRIGVTRKISVYVSEYSFLRFHYWISPGAQPTSIHVELACDDGKRYTARFLKPREGKWSSIDAPLLNFDCEGSTLSPNVEIQALVIQAEFEKGNPSNVHHVAIDEVRINGMRRAGFNFQIPEIETFDHWPLALANDHFDLSDSLNLVATPEVPIESATARLEDFKGEPIGASRELILNGTTWTAEDFHTFPEGDPTGPLQLILEGETENGKTVKSEVRLWYLPQRKDNGRPNLFFDSEDVQNLRDRKESGRGKEIWDRIRGLAETARKIEIPGQGQIEEFPQDYLIQQLMPYFDAVRNTAYGAMLNAWVYTLEGDEEAGAYAKQASLKMAGWDTWTHPWFLTQGRKTYYPVGLAAMYLGIAYDLIHPLLSEEEAKTIREGITKNGIENAYQEYFIDNRVPNHTSNWISHCTAGPLVALCAFYSDAEGAEKANIDRLFTGLAEKFLVHGKATFTPDGGYGEGYAYQNFTLESASPFLAALENLFGKTNLAHDLHIAESYLFPLYISVEGGKTLLDMGDSSDSSGVKTNWAWLSRSSDDPILKNFYHSSPGSDWEDFLWMEEEPTIAGPESLPASRYFPDKGNVVFRTGWGEDDVVLNYHAGPHFNHTHADQGNFRFWGYGEELVSEAGKAGYYTDPYYWSYFIQAGGHNTVLADGNSESQEFGDFKNEVVAFDRRAKIEKVHLSDKFNVVVSELAPVYRGSADGGLKRFTRSVCFVDPGYVVVWDRIRSFGDQTYQWQLFPPKMEGFSIDGRKAYYKGENAELGIHVLAPENAPLHALKRPIQMGEYAEYPRKPLNPRVALRIDGGGAEQGLEFIVALLPTRKDGGPSFQFERIIREGAQVIRIARPEGMDEIVFDEANKRIHFTRSMEEDQVISEAIDLN